MKARKFFSFVVALSFVLSACQLIPGSGGGESPQPQEPVAPPTSAPTPTLEPTPTPEIVHTLIPSAGTKQVANAHDNEESLTYEDKNVYAGDIFRINRFERPFTANDMEYLPYIDIVDISMTQDSNFYYVQIKLSGIDPSTGGANGYYAVDYDLNIDGRAELLVVADHPASSDWTTDGVSIYVDENNDVGGENILPDAAYTGNGFEKKVFDSGIGSDPDAAWVRFTNAAKPIVEIAFKRELIKAAPTFMWSATATRDALDPSRFYFNDTYSEESAGSPMKTSELYPVQGLAGVDNTCRLPAGFTPTGNEPLGCSVAIPEAQAESSGGGGGLIFIPINICLIFPSACLPVIY